jgi:ketosteroid isomerase-like protein
VRSDDALRTAEQLYAALETDDVAGFLSLCADDATVSYPAQGKLGYGGVWDGKDGVEGFLDAHDMAEEILAFEVEQLIGEDSTVMARGSFTGRAKPVGTEWSTEFVHILEIVDGRLRRWEAFFDTAAAIEAHSGAS